MLFDMPQARREAVQVRLQDHAIVTMTGAELPTVRSAIDLSGGRDWGAVRGRAAGDGQVLSQAQEATIQRMIIDKRSEQLKIDLGPWSSAALGQFIE
jgi:hypothetical protein